MIEEAIIAYLKADTGVKALVGTRVFPVSAPQGAKWPRITLFRVDGAPLASDDGIAGIEPVRLQVDCWSQKTYSDAKLLARAVIAALNGFDGTMGTVNIPWIELDAERDMLAETGSNVADYPQRVSLDFSVWLTS